MGTVEASYARMIVDYALGYELMRAQLRAALGGGTVEELAETLGVDVDLLRNFFAGQWPSKKLWDAGVAHTNEHAVTPVHMEAVSVNLLADQFPEDERIGMRRAFAAAAATVYQEHGYRVPEGLAELAGVEPGEGKRAHYPEPEAPTDQTG